MIHQYEIYSKKYNLMGKITCLDGNVGVSFHYDKTFYSTSIIEDLPEDDLEVIREIGVRVMEDFIEKIIAGEVARKVYLLNWHIEPFEHKGLTYIRAVGNVVGHYRFEDSEWIHTSDIEEIDVDEESSEVIICTRNTRFFCKIDSWDFEEQDLYVDVFPNYEYYKNKYKVEKEDPIEPGKVLLSISNYDSYYFHDIFYKEDESSEKMKFHTWPHVGMFQDSFLIHNEDFCTFDIRYFPHPGNIEFYAEHTNGKPFFIENVGTEVLYAQTSVGIIKLEPGERKEVIAENTEKEKMFLSGGDLYPATVIE